MGSDGAHLGVGAKRALDTILGGAEQPTEDERMDPHQMREWLMGAQWPLPDGTPNEVLYNECARYAAKLVLFWLLESPSRASTPVEMVYDWDSDPTSGAEGMKPEYTRAVGWYERMKADGIDLADLGLSGFMWGWACNAARYCVELPPVSNPAIITVKENS